MKQILITGGAGFIGHALYLKLRNDKNNKIFILDLKKKIKTKIFDNNCVILKVDVSSKRTFKLISSIKFDTIYHLAAETSTYLCERRINKCFLTNIVGTYNLYDYCKNTLPKNIIFTSSMSVYGKNAINAREDSNCNPSSFYGTSKYLGENILLRLEEQKINVKIFRLFNVYGPNQDYENLFQGMLSIYLAQIIKKNQVNVTGSLSRCRDFVFIDDVISCITNTKIIRSKKYKIFNLGTGIKTNIKKLIYDLFYAINKKPAIKILKGHKGDTFISYANISKLKQVGWNYKTPLKIGINKTIKNIKKYYENSSFAHGERKF